MKCQIKNIRNGFGKQKHIKYAEVVLLKTNDILISNTLPKCLEYVKKHYPNDFAQSLISTNHFK